MVVRRTGLPDVGFNEKAVLGDVTLTSLEALEYLGVAAAAPAEFQRARLINVAMLGEHDREVEERLQSRSFHGDGHGDLSQGDFGFHKESRTPAALGVRQD